MFTREDLIDNRIGDLIDDDTKILTEFREGYSVKEKILTKGNIFVRSHGDMSVIYADDLVLCAVEDKIVALFYVYDLYNAYLIQEMKAVVAVGHETCHLYGFEDGHYEERKIRSVHSQSYRQDNYGQTKDVYASQNRFCNDDHSPG
jgi:hypothetical protein